LGALISPLPSDRTEFSGKLLNVSRRQKHVEQDAVLLENRIALLKKEEQRAWRKIQQTKQRADEIVGMRRENERRLEEQELMAKQAEERERLLAEEHLKLGESSRRARAKNLEDLYNKKRLDVQRIRQEKQLNRLEVRTQQAEEFQQKKDLRAAVKNREEDIRLAREAERARIEKMNEDMYMMRVQEKEAATRRKEREVSRMEKVEMQLIQKLKNTQQLQQRAFYELENALNGDVA
jgi:hypothetical protein